MTTRTRRRPAAPPVLKDHPATYSEAVTTIMAQMLRRFVLAGSIVLDPFAGTGGIHVHAPEWDTRGIELEPEWAAHHARTKVGDATALPFEDNSVQAIATSPCYGNRMADVYLGSDNEVCRECGGDGRYDPCPLDDHGDHRRPDCPDHVTPVIDVAMLGVCARCLGSGRKRSRRHTYAISLGRKPSDNSAAAMQWGPEYRDLHERAWREAVRVLAPGGKFILNISDHIRDFTVQPVTLWHVGVLTSLGLRLVTSEAAMTPRMGHGENGKLRVTNEWVIVFSLDPF